MTELRGGWIGESIPDAIMDDAASWMAVLDAERCNEGDRLAFARWLDEDTQHRWAFEELSEVWARLRTLTDVEPMLQSPNVVPITNNKSAAAPLILSEPVPLRSDWSTLAAISIVVLGAAVHTLVSSPGEEFVTAAGETRDVVLNDGSMMELNARTTMEVTIDRNRREILLSQGEAVFHVAHDDRPFVVRTDLGTVAALGTTFNVDVDNGVLEVSVIEGEVAVTAIDAPLPLTEFDGQAGVSFARDSELLGAGEWLEVSGSSRRLQVPGTEEFRKRLSWRNGVVSFDEQPLSIVVQEMRRYNKVSIHVADSELSSLRISGEFRTGDAADFLGQLEDRYDIVVDDQYADWVLLRSP